MSVQTLVASAARTASADSGALAGFGLVVTPLRLALVTTAVSGTTPSMAVVVEDTLDGTNWNQLGTFTAVTAAGSQVLNVALPFADQLRVRWTITGTTPSFTFAVLGSFR